MLESVLWGKNEIVQPTKIVSEFKNRKNNLNSVNSAEPNNATDVLIRLRTRISTFEAYISGH